MSHRIRAGLPYLYNFDCFCRGLCVTLVFSLLPPATCPDEHACGR